MAGQREEVGDLEEINNMFLKFKRLFKKNNNTEIIEKILVESFVDEEAIKFASSVPSISVSQVFTKEIVDKVPVLKYIQIANKGCIAIKDKIFAKNILKFLKEADKISFNQRAKFANKMDSNPEFKEEVGHFLIVSLDQFNESEKAALLGKTFSAFVKDHITFSQFQRIGNVLERIIIRDLHRLKEYSDNIGNMPKDSFEMLESVGLVSIWSLDGNSIHPGEIINELGKTIIKYILKN